MALRLRATWNEVGSGATIEDEVYAQKALQDALRKLVKDPYARYKENRIYIGEVRDFFSKVTAEVAHVPVFWNPQIVDCAARITHGRSPAVMDVGKLGFKHRGSGRSLGGSFIHEVEHLHDLLVEIGRIELCEQPTRFDRRADVGVPLFQISGHAGVDLRLRIGLEPAGQRECRVLAARIGAARRRPPE